MLEEAVRTIVLDELDSIGKDISNPDAVMGADLHCDAVQMTMVLNDVQVRLLKNVPRYVFTWPDPSVPDALTYSIATLIGAIIDNTIASV